MITDVYTSPFTHRVYVRRQGKGFTEVGQVGPQPMFGTYGAARAALVAEREVVGWVDPEARP